MLLRTWRWSLTRTELERGNYFFCSYGIPAWILSFFLWVTFHSGQPIKRLVLASDAQRSGLDRKPPYGSRIRHFNHLIDERDRGGSRSDNIGFSFEDDPWDKAWGFSAHRGRNRTGKAMSTPNVQHNSIFSTFLPRVFWLGLGAVYGTTKDYSLSTQDLVDV